MVSHPFWEIPGGLVDDLQLQRGEAGEAVLCLVPSRLSRAGERCLTCLQLSALKIHFSIALSHMLCFLCYKMNEDCVLMKAGVMRMSPKSTCMVVACHGLLWFVRMETPLALVNSTCLITTLQNKNISY